MDIEAVQHVRKLRGGSQSHLVRASDGHLYAVKFRNNPQGPCVLFDELLATRLARLVGLPVPDAEIIHVDPWLVENTPELKIELPGRSVPCEPGRHFASRYVFQERYGAVFDYLPSRYLMEVRNVSVFAGALAFDLWTCNRDLRQAVFWRRPRQQGYRVTLIDNGHCLDCCRGELSPTVAPVTPPRSGVYDAITGWQSFEPWLSRIESLPCRMIGACAEGIPEEWCAVPSRPAQIVAALCERKRSVRAAIGRLHAAAAFKRWHPEGDRHFQRIRVEGRVEFPQARLRT